MAVTISAEELRLNRVMSACLAITIICIAIGVIVICFQILIWLKTGVWPGLSVAETVAFLGQPAPQTSWHGVQQILDWLPLSLTLFVIPVICWSALGAIMKDERKQIAFDNARRLKDEAAAREQARQDAYHAEYEAADASSGSGQ